MTLPGESVVAVVPVRSLRAPQQQRCYNCCTIACIYKSVRKFKYRLDTDINTETVLTLSYRVVCVVGKYTQLGDVQQQYAGRPYEVQQQWDVGALSAAAGQYLAEAGLIALHSSGSGSSRCR